MKNKYGILCILGLLLTMLSSFGKPETFHTDNPDVYMQLEGHIENEGEDIRSGLFIFPETIDCLEDVEYEYYCEQGALDNSYMIFLKGNYPDEKSYEAEVDRLANITCSVETSKGNIVNEVEYTEILFDYPAYVTVYHTNKSFEYALVDEESRSVVYVYLKLCEGSEFLQDMYLPREFQGKTMMEYDTNWENQNIYYAPDGDDVQVYYLD